MSSDSPTEHSDAKIRERPSWVSYEVLTLLTLAAAHAYLVRNAVGVAESTIRDDLGLTLTESGWFMGAFFWSYAVLQVPGGALSHRYGTRFALSLFVGAWSVAAVCIGLSPGFLLLMIAQLVMGAAQAGAFPASVYTISHWIPFPRRTIACGVLTMGMQVGAIASSILTGWLIIEFPWRWSFLLYAIPGLLWVIVFLLKFKNDPADDPRVNPLEAELIEQFQAGESRKTRPRQPTPWNLIAKHPAVWFLCGQQVCRAAGYMFFASWFPTFLQQTRGVSVKDSGYFQALVFSGTLAGCLCGGLLTDWIWQKTQNLRLSRSGVGATFLLACASLILAAWFVESTSVAVGLIAVGAFFAALAGPSAFAATIDIGGDHVPQVFGLMNMTGNFAAAACPILVAQLFEWTENWALVLLVFAGIYLAGAISWAFVDSRRAIGEETVRSEAF